MVSKGDENTKKFHNYVKHKKRINIIWKMEKLDGENIRNFHEITALGVSHFQSIYSNSTRYNIEKILKLSASFPRIMTEEDNHMLMEEVSKE